MSNVMDGPSHALLLEIRDGVHQVRERVDILGGLSQLSAQVKVISGKLDMVIAKEDSIMTDLSDLQDQMTALEAAVSKNAADTATDTAEIKSLLDQIATGAGTGATPAQLQALTARAKALVDNINTNNAALEAAIPVPPTA
jgi:peptidoglycan hydrolase CwlO-like protein